MVEYENICRGAIGFNPPKKVVKNPFWKEELVKKMAENNGIHENVIRKDLGMELVDE
ncbi:hypothetical protein [Vagococcus fluvialis]|uniref:hypothetical protein n=1 Tax=Vagococcus fluvialis TaxID=2738 RepID=UPI0020349A03|nr:hypothetical protein [Vagococcus fluvialis]MCM2138845.1 hypothetical protein [Vagococcus fluvialis]